MTVGLINSWDKATARCVLRLLPDRLIVYNRHIRKNLIERHAVRSEMIFIGGIPQYDGYFGFSPEPREEFFRKRGLDPRKKLIVYSPLGSAFTKSDWEVIDLMHELTRSGAFGADAGLLVRFPPYDTIDAEELKKRPDLIYEYPGARFSRTHLAEWDMTSEEMGELANTLYHMSVLVCHASSISVDAAVFGKPVINIGFGIEDDNAKRLYGMTHYQQALQTGGIRMVASRDELIRWVRTYFDNPSTDAEERKLLTREQCEFLDGKSGERIGLFLLKEMGLPG